MLELPIFFLSSLFCMKMMTRSYSFSFKKVFILSLLLSCVALFFSGIQFLITYYVRHFTQIASVRLALPFMLFLVVQILCQKLVASYYVRQNNISLPSQQLWMWIILANSLPIIVVILLFGIGVTIVGW